MYFSRGKWEKNVPSKKLHLFWTKVAKNCALFLTNMAQKPHHKVRFIVLYWPQQSQVFFDLDLSIGSIAYFQHLNFYKNFFYSC